VIVKAFPNVVSVRMDFLQANQDGVATLDDSFDDTSINAPITIVISSVLYSLISRQQEIAIQNIPLIKKCMRVLIQYKTDNHHSYKSLYQW
jgi:hypothetical protein